MVWSVAFIAVVVFGVCTLAVGYMCHRAPLIEPPPDDVIEEINRLIGRGKHLRDQLDATAVQFVMEHDCSSEYEIEELQRVIYDSADYAETIQRIQRHRYPVRNS